MSIQQQKSYQNKETTWKPMHTRWCHYYWTYIPLTLIDHNKSNSLVLLVRSRNRPATGSFELPWCNWTSHDHISIKNNYVFCINIRMVKPVKHSSRFINCRIPEIKQTKCWSLLDSKLFNNSTIHNVTIGYRKCP